MIIHVNFTDNELLGIQCGPGHISHRNIQYVFFVCQGIIMPQMYTAAAANIFNLAANYILISSLKLGVM